MKTNNLTESQERWLNLLEKHKGELSIENLQKVRNSVQRTQNSWGMLIMKLQLLCLEYPLKGENDERSRTNGDV